MLQWNKMNPNYYLCVFGYEGLDENTDSILFVNSLRPFILPPAQIANKKPIHLIIATPPELCQEIDSMKDERSRRDVLDEFSIFAHCFPISSLPRMLTTNHNKPYVCENCLHIYSTAQVLKRHHQFGCLQFHKAPEHFPSQGIKFKGSDYRKLGKVPAHISMDEECYLQSVVKDAETYSDKGSIHTDNYDINPAMKIEGVRKIPNLHKIHVPYAIHVILRVTKAEYMNYLPDSLFQNKSKMVAFSLLKGDDCNDQFIRLMWKVNNTFIKSLMGTDFSLNWTKEEREKSKSAKTCHICGRKSTTPHGKKGFCSGII